MLKLHFDISSVQLVGYGLMMAIPPLFLVDELLRNGYSSVEIDGTYRSWSFCRANKMTFFGRFPT